MGGPGQRTPTKLVQQTKQINTNEWWINNYMKVGQGGMVSRYGGSDGLKGVKFLYVYMYVCMFDVCYLHIFELCMYVCMHVIYINK